MSYLKKKWSLSSLDIEGQNALSSGLKLSLLTSQILINRGLADVTQAERFLSPKLGFLRDPLEIPHMKEAATRILLAKERGEKVLIYGDYDVDGVTSTVLLLEALKYLGINVSYYIPHRYGEGYGLNKEAIKQINEQGINLIVTVDCGISNKKEIELANALGMEVVVTDHHNIPLELPLAYCVVDPKLIQEDHPSKNLSGVGVAFKLAWALFKIAKVKEKQVLVDFLDLVALGSIADVVPLNGENRILVVQGLNILNQRKRLGLDHLASVAKISNRIGSHQVNFGLSPRINAAGRIEHAKHSVELLLSKDPIEARQFALELNQINIRRQGIGSDIREEVLSLIDLEKIKDQRIIFLSGEEWHPGVIGIVASRVVDEFNRPAVLVGVQGKMGRGSARSIDGVSIFGLLKSCEDLFADFGGHEGAAGFSILVDKIPELEQRLQKVATETLDPGLLAPKLLLDLEINLADISLKFIKELESLEPYGEGNSVPVFMTRNVILREIRTVGAKARHLKLRFSDGRNDFEVIGFGLGVFEAALALDKNYDIAYNLSLNEYQGERSPQLSLLDIRDGGEN